jgi:hypothetical protein
MLKFLFSLFPPFIKFAVKRHPAGDAALPKVAMKRIGQLVACHYVLSDFRARAHWLQRFWPVDKLQNFLPSQRGQIFMADFCIRPAFNMQTNICAETF